MIFNHDLLSYQLIFERLLSEAKPFHEREHDWDEVLIDASSATLTRGDIRDYYMENADRILPYLKGHDIIVLIGISKGSTVLRRNLDGKPIRINRKEGIDDPQSLEYWANRRVIEFHPAIDAMTDMVWVDIDVHEGSRKRANEIAPDIATMLRDEFGGRVETFDSGKSGIHVQGFLGSRVPVDEARKRIRGRLDDMYAGDDELTTGIAKGNQVRLDVTTLKDTGSIRAPYSMSVEGRVKMPLDLDVSEGKKKKKRKRKKKRKFWYAGGPMSSGPGGAGFGSSGGMA